MGACIIQHSNAVHKCLVVCPQGGAFDNIDIHAELYWLEIKLTLKIQYIYSEPPAILNMKLPLLFVLCKLIWICEGLMSNDIAEMMLQTKTNYLVYITDITDIEGDLDPVIALSKDTDRTFRVTALTTLSDGLEFASGYVNGNLIVLDSLSLEDLTVIMTSTRIFNLLHNTWLIVSSNYSKEEALSFANQNAASKGDSKKLPLNANMFFFDNVNDTVFQVFGNARLDPTFKVYIDKFILIGF